MVCAQGATVDGSVKVPCTEKHDWRAVTTIVLGDASATLPRRPAVQARTKDFCSKSVGRLAGLPGRLRLRLLVVPASPSGTPATAGRCAGRGPTHEAASDRPRRGASLRSPAPAAPGPTARRPERRVATPVLHSPHRRPRPRRRRRHRTRRRPRDACYRLGVRRRRWRRPVDKKPVPCTGVAHRGERSTSGQLSTSTSRSTATRVHRLESDRLPAAASRRSSAAPLDDRRLSMLRAVWFTPTVEQAAPAATGSVRRGHRAAATTSTSPCSAAGSPGALDTADGPRPLRAVRHRRARHRRLRAAHLLRARTPGGRCARSPSPPGRYPGVAKVRAAGQQDLPGRRPRRRQRPAQLPVVLPVADPRAVARRPDLRRLLGPD